MEVGDLLAECARTAAERSASRSEAHRLQFCSCRDSLSAELGSLLQEAMDMKWPFVPEKWQFKQLIGPSDKTNLSNLIREHLPKLLTLLKASIMFDEAPTALAVIFLVDRFLYWTDQSSQLLKIARLLHKAHPDTPIAPQLVIRQSRVYLNSGKLQKAEFILSSLIKNCGTTGCWSYHSDSDRALVQAVSVQVRGTVLQKLGLWREAAELIWASLVGFYALPQPDRKGIGTSLGILANILVSMNDEDFHSFRTNPDIRFERILGDESQRLLSAALAAKMAVISSQYTSLYVLTNVTAQGTCLLSYSFSLECPDSQRNLFLQQAREAFAIGLLTKAEDELVTSQQELHTFIKAAFSITVTHKWLSASGEVVPKASQACQEALALFYEYCRANDEDKDALCARIMHLVAKVKLLLGVVPFPNSDKGSFIPDHYRDINDSSVNFTLEDFSKILQRFEKYHASVSETAASVVETSENLHRLCLADLGTTVEASKPEGSTGAAGGPCSAYPHPKAEVSTTCESADSSSWQKLSMSSSGSSQLSGKGDEADVSNESCASTEADEDGSVSLQTADKNQKLHKQGSGFGITSNTTSPKVCGKPEQGGIETLDSEKRTADDVGEANKHSTPEEAALSLSQLMLRTTSDSLDDSFSSQYSWEKLSSNQSSYPSKAGSSQTSQTPDSKGSFFIMETDDCDLLPQSNPQRIHGVQSNMDIKKHPGEAPNSPEAFCRPEQFTLSETSTESSFEMLEGSEGSKAASVALSPRCYSCLNPTKAAATLELSLQDYQALLAGVCHECLLRRLQFDERKFRLDQLSTAHSALHLKFSKEAGLWTARETCVYIGTHIEMNGNPHGSQREAIWVQFLHQEERLSSYVGKNYLKPKEIKFHLNDVERQMTAQYYVTEFNKRLYDKNDMAQIFYIPSEALLILNGKEIVGCITVEPFILGNFVKLTNNTRKKVESLSATKYGIAFGHFTYLLSKRQEVVVDLMGDSKRQRSDLPHRPSDSLHQDAQRPLRLCRVWDPLLPEGAAWTKVQ
ncbi:alpha-protein kinase 1 isoform X2 [Oryzias melastigma]|uniref:alpha-protein kinase 1 isoform X2 n=1 Tax=Oryzias melastigma TaxID=30732 RepID=UPI00168D575C|nr:alpha-protein kinase 1 isoform X2 [Oryzias melastigma]